MSWVASLVTAAALAAAPAAGQAGRQPRFEAPGDLMCSSGRAGFLRLTGVQQGTDVRLAARRTLQFDRGKIELESEATFKAPSEVLDLAQVAPIRGTYSGADIHGLFWSMSAAGAGSPATALPPQVTRISAFVANREIALLDLQPDTWHVSTSRIGHALGGSIFMTGPGPGPRPVVIVLGGSEGGVHMAEAIGPCLVHHGFAVLGYAYYNPRGEMGPEGSDLPHSFVNIPVDRLVRAKEWLEKRRGVNAKRIAIYGSSKGAEFALLAAARFPWIRAVVAIAPSDVVWEGFGGLTKDIPRSGFAFAGRPYPFVRYYRLADEERQSEVRLRRPQINGRQNDPKSAARARITVERIRVPVMLASARDDEIWPSGEMARAIAEARLRLDLPTTFLWFPRAGHSLADTGYSPTGQLNDGRFKVGGTPQWNAEARACTWFETLRFLEREIGGEHSGDSTSQECIAAQRE